MSHANPAEKADVKRDKNPWSHTIYLPQTAFPMRAELAKREPQIIDYWRREKIYERLQNIRREAPLFVLHDGPPYANGNFHVGHALNKILKDIINKSQLLQGKRVPYVPGWDCHGLPIELAVLKKLANKKDGSDKDPLRIRKACREYATNYIRVQAEDQTRFGVLWEDRDALQLTTENQQEYSSFYYTMSPGYEAAILEAFAELYKRGHIYKGKRPVLWCPVTATAHAEAEVEYAEHTSPSIYVAFPETTRPGRSVVIWTTTPWTLPANLAVCFHPEFQYAEYRTQAGDLVIAEGLEQSFFQNVGLSFTEKKLLSKDEISSFKVRHPFLERESKVIFGEHVTLEAGTGIVHTAPGHGQEDYIVGLKYGLEPFSPVDHRGRYTDEFPLMQGIPVFEANDKIIELLQQKKALLKATKITHQYPHSWRSHSPLIFRATPQWFLKIEPLRELARQAAEETIWIPAWGKNRFASTIENRPDWCLSRQRYWGVPIPAFSCKSCGATHITAESLQHIISLVRRDGIEVWFDRPAAELLPPGSQCTSCGGNDFDKESDILDVWFDSGVSWYAVLKQHSELRLPADLYLEGSDQHRGWFQSSLWPALALQGRAPYRQVLTHGYVLDEKGRAMSKSLGNVISPVEDVIPKYGADILRLWVSSEDYRTDNKIGFDMLERLADSYRKIRNTFRYLLGNLQDGRAATGIDVSEIIEEIDLWVLHELAVLEQQVRRAYDRYEFHQVYHKTLQFCTVTLSNQYFDIVRDRLYCDGSPESGSSSPRRRSALKTLAILLEALPVMLAPVLSFTAEEIGRLLHPEQSVFERPWPDCSRWLNETLAQKFALLWDIKEQVNGELEVLRKNGVIGAATEAVVELQEDVLPAFSTEELAAYFVVSEVKRCKNITTVTETGKTIKVYKSSLERCPRCWLHHPLTEKGLCARCTQVTGL